MAKTDLTNTTWVFNDIITINDNYSWDINFISNNTNFAFIKHSASFSGNLAYLDSEQNITGVYGGSKWKNEAYKIIIITGGNNVTDITLISWLQANATQVTLVNSTTLETTLHTAGKYCDKNILVKSSDSNLIAENIKKDVSVFGVTGSYAGSGGSPIEVATETEMANILSSATADDNGKIYRYTGTTGTYVNGALYYLEVQE